MLVFCFVYCLQAADLTSIPCLFFRFFVSSWLSIPLPWVTLWSSWVSWVWKCTQWNMEWIDQFEPGIDVESTSVGECHVHLTTKERRCLYAQPLGAAHTFLFTQLPTVHQQHLYHSDIHHTHATTISHHQ